MLYIHIILLYDKYHRFIQGGFYMNINVKCKTKVSLLTIITFYSFNANAIHYEDDSFDNVNWDDNPSLVYMNCTGSIIAGKYLLTAAHCIPNIDYENDPDNTIYNPKYYSDWQQQGLTKVKIPTKVALDSNVAFGVTYDKWNNRDTPKTYNTDHRYIKIAVPSDYEYDNSNGYLNHDIGILTLKDGYNTIEKINFINPKFLNIGDRVNIFGARYLGDKYLIENNQLRSGFATLDNTENDPDIENGVISANSYTWGNHNNTITESGDSGGMWLDENNDIVALTSRGAGSTRGTILYENTQFILENINAWHSPTFVTMTAGEQKTITIQNLHNSTLDINNTISTSGDIALDSNTCDYVAPWGKCDLIVSSANGGDGQITLEEDFVIHVNELPSKYVDPEDEDNGDSDENDQGGSGDSGGGSVGLFSLFGLLLMGLIRRRQSNNG